MRKKFTVLLVLGVMLLCASCARVEMNVNEVATKIASEGSFSEELSEVSDNITIKRFDMDDELVVDCAGYAGTKAVVDEVAVFKTSDTEKVREKIDEYIENQIKSYISYKPDEVSKLDDAYVAEVGEYVVYCVGDIDTAKRIVKEFAE